MQPLNTQHKTYAALQLVVYTIGLEVGSQVQAFQHWLPPCVYTEYTDAAIINVDGPEPDAGNDANTSSFREKQAKLRIKLCGQRPTKKKNRTGLLLIWCHQARCYNYVDLLIGNGVQMLKRHKIVALTCQDPCRAPCTASRARPTCGPRRGRGRPA